MTTLALREHPVNGGRIERIGVTSASYSRAYRLTIPPIGADTYADAQVDDYEHTLPRRFNNKPPQHLRIRARFSHHTPKGTAGFGFWNHPFTREGAVFEPPCNVWFFYSSPESDLRITRNLPGHGFKAAMLNGGRMPKRVMSLASRIFNWLLKVPVVSRATMAAARAAINAREALLDIDMTAWHDYEIEWQPNGAIFRVDGHEVLRAPHPPGGALGFAAWVDNYRATASNGDYEFAYVHVAEEQWLEMEIMDGDE